MPLINPVIDLKNIPQAYHLLIKYPYLVYS